MKISVNILTWNNFDVVHDTLHILKEDLKDIDNEIIIVDNGSTDGSDMFARIKNKENRGVSVGKNQALDISQGEYIFMLDGDILPVPNSILLLLDWLENNPDKKAIGFYPNKFVDQRNKNGQKHHEEYCHELWNPKIHTQIIAFYGLFHASLFREEGLRFPEYPPFNECGYGWEDSDLYMQLREAGYHQWVAGMNGPVGKYYHNINSSIREMGQDKYMQSSKARHEAFKKHWGEDLINKYYA